MARWQAGLLFLGLLGAGCPGPEPDPPPPAPVDPVHDALSRPVTPTLDPAAFAGAVACQTCHPQHYAEWQTSRHAYAMRDEVFRRLVAIRQADYAGAQDQFCTQCHSAICARGGACVDGFSFDALPPVALEGVTCEACHRVSGLERRYNSGHVLDPGGPMRGTIEDPATSPFHATEYSPLHATSEFCAGCHDVIELSGLNLERPFAEWSESPAAGTTETCQSCHMPTREGVAAEGGPPRTVHEHRFIGVDLPPDEVADAAERALHEARVQALLTSTATLAVTVPSAVPAGAQLDLVLTVKNENRAHNFPTGTTFVRQAWVAVTVTDADGMVVYETGGLDSQGDLRDAFSTVEPYGDADLLKLSSGLVDARGNPTVFPWRAAEHASQTLPPRYARTFTLFVPTSTTTQGPLQVEAKVRFRTFPPFLLRVLGMEEEAARLPIYDVASARAVVAVE
ncbi:MAG: hypothetical protein KC933_08520 [Myxococcales bacterium]|nr:hypothetical protein [Myxococcales bacterium]MCB9649504.1 hypothetical protein [Deltaproteobacteria bacterium]